MTFTDQLAQATSPEITLTLLRDRFGRLRSETVNGRTLTHTYDEWGRRISRTTPTGSTTSWRYDAAGRPTQMLAAGRSIAFAYDAAGREVSRRIAGVLTWTNAFDAAGRLTAQTIEARRQAIQQRTYAYRADGNVVGIDDHVTGPRRITLDASGRVTAVQAANWSETYAYDEAGNQVFASWPAEPPRARGRRSPRLHRHPHHDSRHGPLRTRLSGPHHPEAKDPAVPQTRHVALRMGYRGPPGRRSHPGRNRWRYTYDPLGRRTRKLRLADDGETVLEHTEFTWDGTTLCEQTTVSAQVPNPVTLTWDHHGLHPITQTERITSRHPQSEIDSRFFAIITDLVGRTPHALVDKHGRELAWQTRSALFGDHRMGHQRLEPTPLAVPGTVLTPETGLHYNYARYYDPETARSSPQTRWGSHRPPTRRPTCTIRTCGPIHWASLPVRTLPRTPRTTRQLRSAKKSPHARKAPSAARPTTSTSRHSSTNTQDSKARSWSTTPSSTRSSNEYRDCSLPTRSIPLKTCTGVAKVMWSKVTEVEIRVSWNEFTELTPTPHGRRCSIR